MKNHLISAETALDSNDRYSCGKKITGMHFLLDVDYLEVLKQVLVQ